MGKHAEGYRQAVPAAAKAKEPGLSAIQVCVLKDLGFTVMSFTLGF